ncbi:MAG: peptidoglycan DD-metalloendopeptidase family protein [Burkholderiales bacterium]
MPQPTAERGAASTRTVLPAAPAATVPQTTSQPAASTVPAVPAVASARTDGRVEFHTVQKGDTLALLAMQYGVDYKDIALWNQIENPNQVKIGQVLRVAPPGDVIATPIVPGATAPEAKVLPGGVIAGGAATGQSGAATQNGYASDTMKSAPKAIKLPYSADALTLVQNPGLEGGQLAMIKPGATVPDATLPPPALTDEVTEWAWPALGKIKGFFSETNKGLDISGTLGQPVMASAAGKVIYVGSSVPRMGKLLVISHSKNYLSIYAHNDKILVKEGQAVTKGQKVAEMGNTDSEQVKLHFEIRQMGKPVDPMKYLPGDKLS